MPPHREGHPRALRLLVIDARILTPNRDGGSLRMFGLLRLFLERGLDVSFVPSFPQSFPPFDDTLADDTARLERLGVALPAAGTATVEEYLARAGRTFDIVMVSGAFTAARHLAAVRAHAPEATLVFDTIDLHHLREYRAAKLTGNVPRLKAALALKKVELRAARTADVTLVVSEREQEVLRAEDASILASVIPNIHDVHPNPAPLDHRRDLMFLGAFTFDPNADAMTHFVRHVLPLLRQRLPGVRLHIVGSDPTPDVLALQSEDVLVTGYVENLAGYFDRCRAFVAPLRFGAGIKGKLLLSLAHGLPAVASPIAAEGLPAVSDRDLLVADTPAAWCDAVVRLYTDATHWRALSAHGQALVNTHYSPAAVGRRVDALLDSVLARRRTGLTA